jgi:hypothetical protein
LTDVGTAFAFSHKFLFTAFHVVEEPDPEFEVDGIYISEPLNPLKFIHEVKVVGMSKELDVAVLECLPVHFFRLPLRCTALQSFSSVYTVQRTESATTTVHCGRAYPGNKLWEGRCDAPSKQGCSGGPVLDRHGQVVGMFKGRDGEIDGVFIISEGLLHALQIIKGNSMTWRDWGFKAVVGAPSASSDGSPKSNERKEESLSRKRHSSEKDGANKRRASEKDGSNKRRANQLLSLNERDVRPRKLPWKPSALDMTRHRVA